MPEPEVANRRPLSFRNWKIFEKLAARLARAGVKPNTISVASMVFAGAAAACLVATAQVVDGSPTQRVLWIAAGLLIQMRLIANLLDGMVAIEGGIESPLGELFNEVPDRVSDTAILVAAGYAAGSDPRLGFAAAIVALFVAYVRAMGASVGVGQQFLGLMAKQQRMAILTATGLLHGLLPVVWTCFGQDRCGLMVPALALIIAGGVGTSARRLMRIALLMKQAAGQR